MTQYDKLFDIFWRNLSTEEQRAYALFSIPLWFGKKLASGLSRQFNDGAFDFYYNIIAESACVFTYEKRGWYFEKDLRYYLLEKAETLYQEVLTEIHLFLVDYYLQKNKGDSLPEKREADYLRIYHQLQAEPEKAEQEILLLLDKNKPKYTPPVLQSLVFTFQSLSSKIDIHSNTLYKFLNLYISGLENKCQHKILKGILEQTEAMEELLDKKRHHLFLEQIYRFQRYLKKHVPHRDKETSNTIKHRPGRMVEKISPLTFRTHWEHYTMPGEWNDLRVDLYSGLHGQKEADKDLELIEQPDKFDFNTAGPVYLKGGTNVLIKPKIPGFRFEPEEVIVTWYGEWVPVVFRMMTEFERPLLKWGKKVEGQVNFFVGPLLINEININMIIKDHLSGNEKFTRNEKAKPAYRKIFPSYAHKDEAIVRKIELAFQAFGDKYMRDVKELRCGQKWEPTILKLIKEADVFHLFWSKAAKKSHYVEMEWQEALKRREEYFIRPFYWEEPMPEPPPELRDIQFSMLNF